MCLILKPILEATVVVILLLSNFSREHCLYTNATIKNEKVGNKWKEKIISRKIGESIFLCENDELFHVFNANTMSVLEDYSLRCPSAYIILPYSSMLTVLHLNFQPQRKGKCKVWIPQKSGI